MINRKGTAFSLIGLSVVLIFFALFISIIVSASNMLTSARLNSARNLTNSSPAADIDGMVLWLDATSEKAFKDEIDDGDSISEWKDIKISHLEKYVAQQTDSAKQPIYRLKGINNLPVVEYDSNDSLNVDDFYLSSYMTLFLVGKFEDSTNSDRTKFAIEHTASAINTHGFYVRGDNTYPFWIERNAQNAQPVPDQDPDYPSNIDAAIRTFRNDGTNISYKTNNGIFYGSDSSNVSKIVISDTLYIGTVGSKYTEGYMGELIIYDRALTDDEVDTVVEYLNKKWEIY